MSTTYRVISAEGDPGFLQEFEDFLDDLMKPNVHELIKRREFGFNEKLRSLANRYKALAIVNVVFPDVGEIIEDASCFIGTTEIAGTFVVPDEGDVQEDVEYGDPTDTLTGTFVVPTEAQVEVGVTFGNDAEFTGTLGA